MAKFRDLTIVSLSPTDTLVIAADSSAGIGEKPDDQVSVDPAVTAAFSLRVPLLELLCYGATPICVVDTIGNEMNPTGEKMIAGIKSELERAGLASIPLTGSTEDNMTTMTTSVGVTVIGRVPNRPEAMTEALTVYQIGTPLVGDEVKDHLEDVPSYDLVRKLKSETEVRDMLPVGSKGIAYEVSQIAIVNDLNESEISTVLADNEYLKSAGPATVILVAVGKSGIASFEKKYPQAKRLIQLDKK
ncbi:AIR synthase related protein [Lentilactobacillus sp. Marseille-Q4993]|uniref:AIR synthase related protein n=1 Tax=Lentilactobacillus sp. Marseille-Q4993 TaxID=3039492 RepID=UPI0024BD3E28|nr:AIR synthase related protein [Lentilactobacillus sp. Marseille-Q4993]